MVRICLCVHVCAAPPMIVGAWSMAVVDGSGAIVASCVLMVEDVRMEESNIV